MFHNVDSVNISLNKECLVLVISKISSVPTYFIALTMHKLRNAYNR